MCGKGPNTKPESVDSLSNPLLVWMALDLTCSSSSCELSLFDELLEPFDFPLVVAGSKMKQPLLGTSRATFRGKKYVFPLRASHETDDRVFSIGL